MKNACKCNKKWSEKISQVPRQAIFDEFWKISGIISYDIISEKTVYTAIEKGKSEEVKDNRGQHENRPQKMSVSTEQSVTAHIKQFPVKESHYVRRDTKKLYLEKTLNISKKYRLYSDEWFMGANYPNYVKMATKRQYETVFNTKFNYSFQNLKKICAANVYYIVKLMVKEKSNSKKLTQNTLEIRNVCVN
ncbi:hypothetical protein ACJJTC_004712 [Scirpophaga incertulas]